MEFLSKTEAFIKIENEKNTPIDKSGYKFQFTRRWFSQRNQKTWSSFFTRKYSHKRSVNMIQIGVFESADLVWCFQNILGHAGSRVVAIDPWLESRKIDQQKMDSCCERAQHNLHIWRRKVEIVKGKSKKVLRDLINNGISIHGKPITKGNWDLIVIDGDHRAPAVYFDALYSFQLIKKNGWMVFDDFHNRVLKKNHVQKGIQQFLEDHENDVELVWQNRFCICLRKK